jgi:asparaginyl-tRNA synthetase
MKTLYIKDLYEKKFIDKNVWISAWICSKRDIGEKIFIDLVDSTGKIQSVVNKGCHAFNKAKKLKPESSVRVKGHVLSGRSRNEIIVEEIEQIGDALVIINPSPRSNFDFHRREYVNQILSNRHLYIRNEKMMAILRFRHKFIEILREWFRQENFIEFHAPILTELTLYETTSAFKIRFFDTDVFLTQCASFYLESAIQAFEKVYFINPSFRAESSTGKRYLAEYWHLKAEIAFADLDGIINFTEKMLSFLAVRLSKQAEDELEVLRVNIDEEKLSNIPYPHLTYENALEKLNNAGTRKKFGKSLNARDETILSKMFDSPFWLTGLPSSTQPFLYTIDPSNPKVSKSADLIATDGFGEVLGVAEKIWQIEALLKRMEEKGLDPNSKYKWVCELRKLGSVPHSGLGMGIERMIRWLLKLPHVRDAIPFPRLHKRLPYP